MYTASLIGGQRSWFSLYKLTLSQAEELLSQLWVAATHWDSSSLHTGGTPSCTNLSRRFGQGSLGGKSLQGLCSLQSFQLFSHYHQTQINFSAPRAVRQWRIQKKRWEMQWRFLRTRCQLRNWWWPGNTSRAEYVQRVSYIDRVYTHTKCPQGASAPRAYLTCRPSTLNSPGYPLMRSCWKSYREANTLGNLLYLHFLILDKKFLKPTGPSHLTWLRVSYTSVLPVTLKKSLNQNINVSWATVPCKWEAKAEDCTVTHSRRQDNKEESASPSAGPWQVCLVRIRSTD